MSNSHSALLDQVKHWMQRQLPDFEVSWQEVDSKDWPEEYAKVKARHPTRRCSLILAITDEALEDMSEAPDRGVSTMLSVLDRKHITHGLRDGVTVRYLYNELEQLLLLE